MHRRTASLLGRLSEGDIAVIDHLDMDRDTAQALVDAGVVAVVNAGPMTSGRFPNLGPERLVESGVLVVDNAGPEIFERVKDGTRLRIHEGVVHVGDTREEVGILLAHEELRVFRRIGENLTANLPVGEGVAVDVEVKQAGFELGRLRGRQGGIRGCTVSAHLVACAGADRLSDIVVHYRRS